MAIVRVFALHVRGAAKENAKVVKEVARMVAKQHVEEDVVKVVKGVAMQCAKVIVLLAVKQPVIQYVVALA